MRNFFFYNGLWFFYDWCGKDYAYNPQTYMIECSWIDYNTYSMNFETVSRENSIRPMDVNLNTEMGEEFAKLLTFLSSCIG